MWTVIVIATYKQESSCRHTTLTVSLQEDVYPENNLALKCMSKIGQTVNYKHIFCFDISYITCYHYIIVNITLEYAVSYRQVYVHIMTQPRLGIKDSCNQDGCLICVTFTSLVTLIAWQLLS